RSHAARTPDIGSVHIGVQAIAGIVGNPDGILVIVIGDDTEDGAENLFPGDRHVVLHIDEHRGLDEVARFETFRTALTADQHFGAFFYAFADVGLHAVRLLLPPHRSHGGFWIGRIPHRKCANR